MSTRSVCDAAGLRRRDRVEEDGRGIGAPRDDARPARSRRSAQIASCSIAPARNVSAAARMTRPPLFAPRAASLAAVVVLPEPLTPTRKMTSRATSGAAAGAAPRRSSCSISSDQEPAQVLQDPALGGRRTAREPRPSARRRFPPRRPPSISASSERLEDRPRRCPAPSSRPSRASQDLGVGHEQPTLDASRRSRTASRSGLGCRRRSSTRRIILANGEQAESRLGRIRDAPLGPWLDASTCLTTAGVDSSSSRALAPASPVGSSSTVRSRYRRPRADLLHRHEHQAQAQVRLGTLAAARRTASR